MPRLGDFALIYTQDPPAADIFNRKEVSAGGAWEIGVTRRVKKPSWEARDGRIISVGEK